MKKPMYLGMVELDLKIKNMIKSKLGGKFKRGFVDFRAKMYVYKKLSVVCHLAMGNKNKKCIIKEDRKCKETKNVCCYTIINYNPIRGV